MAMEMELIAYMRLGNTVYKMYTLQPNRNGLYRPTIPFPGSHVTRTTRRRQTI